VSLVARFSPELSSWIVEELDSSKAPGAVVRTMIEQGMDARVAEGIVAAFISARRAGRPVPTDSVVLDDQQLDYVYESPRLPREPCLRTFDREVRVLARCERPVVAVLADVLDASECEELIALARPRLMPSTVVDPRTGKDTVEEYRNSLGMFFRPSETPLLARLDRRVSEIMKLPPENGEGFQVLHYPTGSQAAPHFDFLIPSNAANQASIARSGQRVSTLVAYLNDVESGGETFFPETGFSAIPRRGHAVYFEYCNRLGQVDRLTLHAGQPVVRGEKWVATKWMRQRPFVSAGSSEPRPYGPPVKSIR
jgi:prolyl 4-hydroxylase